MYKADYFFFLSVCFHSVAEGLELQQARVGALPFPWCGKHGTGMERNASTQGTTTRTWLSLSCSYQKRVFCLFPVLKRNMRARV